MKDHRNKIYYKKVGSNRKIKRRKTWIPPVAVGIALLAILVTLLLIWNGNKGNVEDPPGKGSIPSQTPASAESPDSSNSFSVSEGGQPQSLRLSFSAVGDNLIHDGIYIQAARRAGGEGYDFSYAYENLKYFFEPFDVNWINQETLVNDELPPDTYPNFSSPGELGKAAYDVGWRVFSISNNHTYDKLAKGIEATRAFWESMPEDVVVPGLYVDNYDDNEILLQQVNGITLAYLSYTEHTNGIPTPSGAEAHVIYTSEREVLQHQISRAKELADAVVVSVHWGVEGSHIVTEAQRSLAVDMAAWGADVILGTHPHVIQAVEWLEVPEENRSVLVAYSLGNFLSAQSVANNMVGLALTFEISQQVGPGELRSPISIENVKVYPTVTHYGPGYTDIRDYMFRDYTEELARAHGVHSNGGQFSLEYIRNLTQEYISSEFLVLD